MPDVKDFVPELVCLGFDALICAGIYTAYKTTSNIIQNLSEAPEIVINRDLKSQIVNSSAAQVVEEGRVRIPYAVVKGEVSPLGRTVASAYTPEITNGVIQKVVFTEHKRNLSRTGFWIDSERILHQFTNDAPFSLVEPQSSSLSLSRPSVEVVDWSDAVRIDLDTVYDKFEAGSTSLGSHLMGWVQGDMHKGTQITESMLLKGANITAVGEVILSPEGVKIIPPTDNSCYFLTKSSLSSLIKEYESGRLFCKVILGVFAGLGLGLMAFSLYKYNQKKRIEQANQSSQDTINTIRSERSNREERDVPENLQCVVCLGNEREVIILNCGHVCVCADCGSELLRLSQPCPVCRGDIHSVLPAYVS